MSAFPMGKLATAVLLVFGLGACSMAPTYQQPAAPIPTAWAKDAPASAEAAHPLGLEALVRDPALREMVETAIAHNRDLRKAILNVEAARAQYGVQRADRLPTVEAQAAGTRQQTPANLSQTGAATTTSVYQAGVGMTSFELDLFGRVRNLSESALQEYLATAQNAQAVRISLAAEVMQTYILRRSAHARWAITDRTLQAREASLELIAHRHSAGAASALELEDARGLVEQARADLEQVQREQQQADNALRLLLGSSQLDLQPPAAGTPTFALSELGAGAPSDLLHTRPDVMAAEALLKARNADIGAARAAFFPRVSLTAFLGFSSPELSELFQGSQRSWSFAPQLSVPIFDAGRNRANLELATVRKDIAVAHYEGTIQTAFKEVADALAANDTLRREVRHRKALFESSQRTLTLSQARYQGGLDSNLRYLDAQRSVLANEIALVHIAAQQETAIVALFKALGGRWYGDES